MYCIAAGRIKAPHGYIYRVPRRRDDLRRAPRSSCPVPAGSPCNGALNKASKKLCSRRCTTLPGSVLHNSSRRYKRKTRSQLSLTPRFHSLLRGLATRLSCPARSRGCGVLGGVEAGRMRCGRVPPYATGHEQVRKKARRLAECLSFRTSLPCPHTPRSLRSNSAKCPPNSRRSPCRPTMRHWQSVVPLRRDRRHWPSNEL